MKVSKIILVIIAVVLILNVTPGYVAETFPPTGEASRFLFKEAGRLKSSATPCRHPKGRPTIVKEYLVKFKTSDPAAIKSLEDKYDVEFKEEIRALNVYSFPVTGDRLSVIGITEELNREENVEYAEPNGVARTTYADVAEAQEIITDAPWYLAPDRDSIPVLLFLPEIYWRRKVAGVDKGTGLYLSEFIVANPESATSDWSFEDGWKPGQNNDKRGGKLNILYHDTDKTPPQVKKGIKIEDEFGNKITDVDEIRDGIIRVNKKSGHPKPITEPGWHRILLIPKTKFIGTEGPLQNVAGDVYISTYVSYQRWFIKKGGSGWDKEKKTDKETNKEIVAVYPVTKMLKVKVGKKEDGGLPSFNQADRYYDIHNHTMSEYTTSLIEPRLAYGGPLRMVEHCAYAVGMTDTIERTNLQGSNKIFSTDHNCFFSDHDIPEVGPYKEKMQDPGSEYDVLKTWFGEKTGAQEVSLNTEHMGFRSWLNSSHLLVYEYPRRFEGPWHGGRRHGESAVRRALPEKVKLGGKWELDLDGAVKFIGKIVMPESNVGIALNERNENTLDKVMKKLHNEMAKSISAHPLHDSMGWDDPMFRRALGYPDHNERKKNLNKAKQFIFRGFQSWNDPVKYIRSGVRPELFRKLNPFDSREFLALAVSLDETFSHDNFSGSDQPGPWTGMRSETARQNSWNKNKELPDAREKIEGEIKISLPNTRWHPNLSWYRELGEGLLSWMGLVQRGFRYSFKKTPKQKFIRKSFFYAGSDAHGNFNYSDGVLCKSASQIKVSENKIYDNAYARERTYVLGSDVDGLHRGQCITTDGPLVEFMLDDDGKFNSETLKWHDKEIIWENGNGLIGGEGNLDGGRTLLVRAEQSRGPGIDTTVATIASGDSARYLPATTSNLMIKYRWDNTEDFGQKVDLIDVYHVGESGLPETETINGVQVPKPLMQLPVPPQRKQYETKELIKGRPRLTETQILYLGGFTKSSKDMKYHPDEYRCFTNPVWLAPVKMEVRAVPLVAKNSTTDPATLVPHLSANKKMAIIPTGYFQFNFKFPISMTPKKYEVRVRMLDSTGETSGPEYQLGGGIWKEYNDAENALYQGLTHPEIKFYPAWYPQDPQITMVVYIYSDRDTIASYKYENARGPIDLNGNYLNPLARTFTVDILNTAAAKEKIKPIVSKGDRPRIVVTSGQAGGAKAKREKNSFYDIPISQHEKKIIFVLDTSFSMGVKTSGKETLTKLDVAKQELLKAISQLDRTVLYNIITYNEMALVWRKKFASGSAEKDKVINWLNVQKSDYYTNIYDALEKTFKIIGSNSEHTVVFFVSDGLPNRGKQTEPKAILAAVKKWNRGKKVVINTIGLWATDTTAMSNPHSTEEMRQKGEAFMKMLAEQNGGTFTKK